MPQNKAKTEIHIARNPAQKAQAKDLCLDYASWLGIDLHFQGFSEEMQHFPGAYNPVLLATVNGTCAGTVCLKPHTNDVCEMKRLFVKPEYHGYGIGSLLCENLINAAREQGYKIMLLDSLERLKPAIALYRKFGFEECAAYNNNPEKDVVYMQLKL
ncbi:GNAT family N-acetyltransferase [Kordiimonas pumila]|uniref:GNAT family N-acetyltransferase n=1 Tax=Kordiimonas pumila TaxID=2161677 RepID=A0ABV7CZZ9_9PROT|nr:GNAT family N-acetyltransferase [Kordiimonas pumila]